MMNKKRENNIIATIGILSLIWFFVLMWWLDLFGSKIDYVADVWKMLVVFWPFPVFIGYIGSTGGGGKKGFTKYAFVVFGVFVVAWMLGMLRSVMIG